MLKKKRIHCFLFNNSGKYWLCAGYLARHWAFKDGWDPVPAFQESPVNNCDARCGHKQPLFLLCAKLDPESPFPSSKLTHSPQNHQGGDVTEGNTGEGEAYITHPQSKPPRTLRPVLQNASSGTSLVVQWLRLHAPNVGGPASIPGQGTRSCML